MNDPKTRVEAQAAILAAHAVFAAAISETMAVAIEKIEHDQRNRDQAIAALKQLSK